MTAAVERRPICRHCGAVLHAEHTPSRVKWFDESRSWICHNAPGRFAEHSPEERGAA